MTTNQVGYLPQFYVSRKKNSSRISFIKGSDDDDEKKTNVSKVVEPLTHYLKTFECRFSAEKIKKKIAETIFHQMEGERKNQKRILPIFPPQ